MRWNWDGPRSCPENIGRMQARLLSSKRTGPKIDTMEVRPRLKSSGRGGPKVIIKTRRSESSWPELITPFTWCCNQMCLLRWNITSSVAQCKFHCVSWDLVTTWFHEELRLATRECRGSFTLVLDHHFVGIDNFTPSKKLEPRIGGGSGQRLSREFSRS